MAQQASPVRRARLGRTFGSEPTAVSGVVLLLPDGDLDYFGDDWLDLVSLA